MNINQMKLEIMVFHVLTGSIFHHSFAPLDTERIDKQETNVCWPVRGTQFKLIEELIKIKTDWSQLRIMQTSDIFSMTLWEQ